MLFQHIAAIRNCQSCQGCKFDTCQLFLVYINDIDNAVPGEKLKLFADDTNLFVQGPDICHASDHASLLLSKLHCWFVANKLTLSLPKTCYTVFGKNRKDNCVLKLMRS